MTHVPPSVLWFTMAKQDTALLSHLNQFRISRFGHGRDRDIHDNHLLCVASLFRHWRLVNNIIWNLCMYVCVRSVLISSNLMCWFPIWQALVPNILAKSGYSSGLNMYIHTYIHMCRRVQYMEDGNACRHICMYIVLYVRMIVRGNVGFCWHNCSIRSLCLTVVAVWGKHAENVITQCTYVRVHAAPYTNDT